MYLVFVIILIFLALLNIVLHCIGVYLLASNRKNVNYSRRIQVIYLLNMSCIELISSILCLLGLVLKIIDLPDATTAKKIENNLLILKCTLLFAYFLTMVLVLTDKVLQIMMNITYPVFWDDRKADLVVKLIWSISMLVGTIVFIVHHVNNVHFHLYFPFIILPANIIYIVMAFAAYTYIFIKFSNAKQSPYGKRTGEKVLNYRTILKRSRFFIPMSLVMIYIIFQVIPVIVFTLSMLKKSMQEKNIKLYMFICYNIAMLFDAWLCIFLQPEVKKQFRKILRIRRERRSIEKDCKQRLSLHKKSSINTSEVVNEEHSLQLLRIRHEENSSCSKNKLEAPKIL